MSILNSRQGRRPYISVRVPGTRTQTLNAKPFLVAMEQETLYLQQYQVDDKLLFGYSDGTNVFVTFNEEIRPKHTSRDSAEEETGCDPTL